ncbi:MAG: CRTAC1 family protein, partial [Phycisphaerae bacterium]|nr:CRTAC1 family protein [Phycisphaerae bacterium]
ESFASPALGDFDNDGLLDLFFSTVYPRDHCVLYRNMGNWKFTDATKATGISGRLTYQATWADFDNDGDLDLLTGGKLFRNALRGSGWLKVRLVGDGRRINRDAVGAQVRIAIGGRTLTRQVETGTGEGNQNDPTLHFGLGAVGGEVTVAVCWPDGTTQKLTVKPNRTIVIRHAPAAAQAVGPKR